MKKILAILVCAIVLSMTALPATAQTRGRRYNQTPYSRYDNRYDRYDPRYDGRYRDYRYNNRSIWEKHQDKLTTAGGAVAGALIGGMVGGKKGTIIGAVAGGASAAVYTYKIRDPRYRRY
ncbi:MAG: YMGG-like glycine zipper-containing protein [Pyrinomonadaceae bacterium]